jgi:enamine deaminase RidA (YjgF/YER057c/UK114 family)
MEFIQREWGEFSTVVEIRSFGSTSGISEYHAMIRLTNPNLDAAEQFRRIEETIRSVQEQLQQTTLIWKRYFVSDAMNQAGFIISSHESAAVSIVQQPPLDGTKVVVWLYLVSNVQVQKMDDATMMKCNNYLHLFYTQLFAQGKDEVAQTENLFSHYSKLLAKAGCSLAENCQRTWVFVQNVDTHYGGMVVARKKYFEAQGLTADTHYIASTGVEGKYIRPETLVFMDAYAVRGLQTAQIQYLYAPTHLNPTHQYGVTFERGTAIQYGDRRHVYISGTASINNLGRIEHPMDLGKQTDRMFENICALLAEADADMDDVMYMVVYLRDISDYATTATYMKQNYPQIPQVIVWAPVCRPGWLVEVECMAITSRSDSRFADF